MQGNRPAVGIQGASKMRVGRGAIQVALHVVFAGPRGLDRYAGRLGNLHGFGDIVVGGAAAEPASHIFAMHHHLFGFQPGHAHPRPVRRRRHLRGRPDFAGIGAHVRHAV